MRIDVVPFDRDRHLDAAAALLAARHRRDRAREPRLPAAYEEPEACRTEIDEALARPGQGVVAMMDGQVAGFAVMETHIMPQNHYAAYFVPPRFAQLGYSAHAAEEGVEFDVYREMYASLADDAVSRGYFEHVAYIAPQDAATMEAFVSLGFGRQLTCAIRGVEPVERPAASVQVNLATTEDAQIVFSLIEELSLHHARSPIFFPIVREADGSYHEFQTSLLDDPANAHWIAYDDGKPVGMNTFMAPFFLNAMVRPEKTVYLFQGIVVPDARTGGVGSALLAKGVEWAREQGYERVALHFASANIPGARFWQGSGFEPVEHRLRRSIDERIAYANR